PKISKDMVDLAVHILDSKASHFDASKFKDEYEDALKALVRSKASGKEVRIEKKEQSDNVISLMDALQQSLKGGKTAKAAAAKRAAPAARARPAKKAARSTARHRKAS
ncbi:MAG: Ku protein, partial [Tardiphaga sp.]|nr:Ku protein [Tardiphaga sp.]